jgi:hypothetical protein
VGIHEEPGDEDQEFNWQLKFAASGHPPAQEKTPRLLSGFRCASAMLPAIDQLRMLDRYFMAFSLNLAVDQRKRSESTGVLLELYSTGVSVRACFGPWSFIAGQGCMAISFHSVGTRSKAVQKSTISVPQAAGLCKRVSWESPIEVV